METARKMLTGEQPAVPGIPCSTCHQFEDLRKSGQWLTPAEIERAGNKDQYLVSLMPVAVAGLRFAQIAAIAANSESGKRTPQFGVSGKVFRFGIDTAVFCKIPGPGEYRAEARALTSSGWRRFTFPFTVHERPICQEVILDFDTGEPIADTPGAAGATWLTSWIG
jgi:hypothetical protein